MLNLRDHCGFLASARMIFLETATTLFSVIGIDNIEEKNLCCFCLWDIFNSSWTIMITMPCRQQGKSHLGVLDCDSGSISLLDIPFSDLSDVVRDKIFIATLKTWGVYVSFVTYIVLLLAWSSRLLQMITSILKVLLRVFHGRLLRFIRYQIQSFVYMLMMCSFVYCLSIGALIVSSRWH